MALFIIDLALLAWVKFTPLFPEAAISATVIASLAVIALVFLSVSLARDEARLKFNMARRALQRFSGEGGFGGVSMNAVNRRRSAIASGDEQL